MTVLEIKAAAEHSRILSYGGADPNVVVMENGRLYRRIPPAADGRWRGLGEFVGSEQFRTLMEKGLIISHNQKPEIREGVPYFEVEYLPHFSHFSLWTWRQKIAALDLICRLNIALEGSKRVPSDCHIENATYRWSEPIYVDIGSFIIEDKKWATSNFRSYCNEKNGITLKSDSWEALRSELAELTPPPYDSTEWTDYDKGKSPASRSDISPESPEQDLIAGWANDCGASTLTDAGCNRGRWARMLAVVTGKPVLAIDHDERCVDACWREARRLRLQITSLRNDLFINPRDVPISDMAVFSSVMHHWYRKTPSWDKITATMGRMAKRLMAVEWINGDDIHVATWKDLQRANYTRDHFLAKLPAWELKATSNPESPKRTWLLLERRK